MRSSWYEHTTLHFHRQTAQRSERYFSLPVYSPGGLSDPRPSRIGHRSITVRRVFAGLRDFCRSSVCIVSTCTRQSGVKVKILKEYRIVFREPNSCGGRTKHDVSAVVRSTVVILYASVENASHRTRFCPDTAHSPWTNRCFVRRVGETRMVRTRYRYSTALSRSSGVARVFSTAQVVVDSTVVFVAVVTALRIFRRVS